MAYELSRVLDTGLDKETLSILIALCENGVNPEVRTDVSLAATVSLVFADPRPDLDPLSLSLSQALALVVKELKRESEDFRAQEHVA